MGQFSELWGSGGKKSELLPVGLGRIKGPPKQVYLDAWGSRRHSGRLCNRRFTEKFKWKRRGAVFCEYGGEIG